VPLTPKVYEVLQLLVQNSGHMLGKEELLKAVWPDSFVEEGNLARNISTLRAALGESPEAPQYIETIPKRGYRFVASVLELQSVDPDFVRNENRAQIISYQVDVPTPTALESFNAPPTPSIEPPHSRLKLLVSAIKGHQREAVVAVVTLVIAVAAVIYFIYFTKRGETIDSVAVMPFVNVNGDANTEYLAEGITDSIINNLSQLPNLKVTAFSSALAYKGEQTDAQAIGRDLNVRAVLMSRLTQQGDNVSISVELVDSRDNHHLWGERYNRKVADIVTISDDISREVCDELRLKLSGDERKQLTKHYTENAEALRNYWQGISYVQKRSPPDLKTAIEYFQEAIRLDHGYALAYVGIARAYYAPRNSFMQLPEADRQQMLSAVQTALEIDNDLAEAHALLGGIRQDQEDWAGAERELKRAMDLNANGWGVRWLYIRYLSATGRHDEAINEARQSVQNDPLSANSMGLLGLSYLFARHYDEAIQSFQKAVEKEPEYAPFHTNLARAYVQKAMYEEALAEFQKAMTINREAPGRLAAVAYTCAISGKKADAQKILDELKERAKSEVISPECFAIIYAGLGENDHAFAWLGKFYKDRTGPPYLTINLMLDRLRLDPRFSDLARRKGLAP
jgi:TolB-like protein/DNA-binding winged helix-turn-helix (wHTH) protein/Tfp pilus assembly protein PilF